MTTSQQNVLKQVYLIVIFVIQSITLNAIQLTGFIRDNQTGEVLIGANITDIQHKTGTTSDNRGFFSLIINEPSNIYISYVGYQTEKILFKNNKDTSLLIFLKAENNLKEVQISGIKKRQYDVTTLNSKELSLIPTLGGKPDIIKSLQMLPGVLTQTEGMSIMMVRGGEPGQNQYLLDNVPLFYVNHLGGFTSVFNPDMIHTVDFYKGNFPAKHGGKLSSIVDITQREGDISKHHGSFSLGLTDVSLSLEGPMAHKKISYMITARKTLVDYLLLGLSASLPENYAMLSYGYHDINAKLSWKPNNRNTFSLNLYQGDDYLNYRTKPWKMTNNEKSHINQQWGNWLISTRWNTLTEKGFHGENIISLSRYRNQSGQEYRNSMNDVNTMIKTVYRSSVNDYSFRTSWKYSVSNNWQIGFGGHTGFLQFEPSYNYSSYATTPVLNKKYEVFETAGYFDNKITILKNLKFQPSFRISNFTQQDIYFSTFEPRINITYSMNDECHFNLNYMRVSQHSHLIFVQTELLKREVWLPATKLLPPEISNQFSLSWNSSFREGKYSSETNVYYKKMTHLVCLKEGYENMPDITDIENKVEFEGTGIALGAELTLKKLTGKWTGSIAYAFSKANRIYPSVNNGNPYEYDYNRPHSLTFNINRKLGEKWNINSTWIFQSGMPYTPAIAKYPALQPWSGETKTEILYGDKNSDRMQPYHRLDIGLNHTITTKNGNKAIWTFFLYNAYNHINPYGYYYDNDVNINNLTLFNSPLQLYKTGFFTILPSVAYKVFFDFSKKPDQKETKVKKRYNWLYY
jgi:hypothetical protein